jgi:hypothetical protein
LQGVKIIWVQVFRRLILIFMELGFILVEAQVGDGTTTKFGILICSGIMLYLGYSACRWRNTDQRWNSYFQWNYTLFL